MARVLVLACGNPLRGDDGVGWRIAEAFQRAHPTSDVEIITAPQLTPEMAERVSGAKTVVFVDASATEPPGSVSSKPVEAAPAVPSSLTHSLEPTALLAMVHSLYGRAPRRAFALAVGGASFALGEELSEPVRRAVPQAVRKIGALLAPAAKPKSR